MSRFPKEVVDAIRDGKILGIRAGTKPHRIIGIWAVVVEGRVFVRSYSLKERSWYRTFLEERRERPTGPIVKAKTGDVAGSGRKVLQRENSRLGIQRGDEPV